jgi:Holliday junction resolvase RusA-like endonuclease
MILDRRQLRKTPDGDLCVIAIQGEPCSKANSRRLVMIKGRMVPIKSKKALAYSDDFAKQCPTRKTLFTEDLVVCAKILYKTKRPDLDESLILDLMQGKIYKNDRAIKLKYIEWGLDRESPRCLIVVAPLEKKNEAISTFNELVEGDGWRGTQE